MRVATEWTLRGHQELPRDLKFSLERLEQYLRSLSRLTQRDLAATRNSRIVSAPAHGATSILELWGHNGSWVKAQANTSGTPAIGLSISIPDADHLELAVAGWQTLEAHGLAIGQHWTSTSVAGGAQTTPPAPGNKVQLAFRVVTADDLVMFPTEATP